MGALASVVVPVFNGMPHLRDLVDSLLAQDYPDLEIIFAETGSTDGSREFLSSLSDPRIRVIDGAKGAAANWDTACRDASGEFVKLVCQDDLLNPDAVSRQVSQLQENPAAVMAIASRDIIDASGKVLYRNRGGSGLRAGLMRGPEVIHACYLGGTNVIGEPLCVTFRREALWEAMPWEDRNPLVLDLMLYEKAARLGDVFVDKSSIGGFRVSTSSWSTRLAGVQRDQFRRWQHEYAMSLPVLPSAAERGRASAALHLQTTMRLAAYRWLSMKGSFHASPDD